MSESIDYNLTEKESETLHAVSYFPEDMRIEFLSKFSKKELISMLSGLVALGNSVVKNSYEMCEELALINGVHHPDRVFNWNLPSITGALLGIQNAAKVNQDISMCEGCAYRLGTAANQSFTTQDTIIYCRDNDTKFMCHHPNPPGTRKPKCVGHQAALKKNHRIMTKEEKVAADKEKEREDFLVQYWGQSVMYRSDQPKAFPIRVPSGCDLRYNVWYLELTDLRNITDEHAEVIAKRYFPVHDKSKFYGYIREEWLQKNIDSLDGFSIDFLRQHGYAIRFRSYSVEDLVRMGWVKIKEVI